MVFPQRVVGRSTHNILDVVQLGMVLFLFQDHDSQQKLSQTRLSKPQLATPGSHVRT
jgi:hypothetical protein